MKRYITADIGYLQDEPVGVRVEVAKSHNLRQTTMQRLLHDPEYLVRVTLARNSSIPEEVVVELSKDNDAVVRRFAAKHPNIPQERMLQMVNDDLYVRCYLAQNENAPAELLEYLSHDTAPMVRESVAFNRNTSVAVLRQLVCDHAVPDVRKAAIASLQARGERLFNREIFK